MSDEGAADVGSDSTTVGILAASSILGKELGERLFAIDPSLAIRGFSGDPADEGELAEFGRAATLIEVLDLQRPDPELLAGLDLFFVPVAVSAAVVSALREALPPTAVLVLVDAVGWSAELAGPELGDLDLVPVVAGLPLAESSESAQVLVSPPASLVCQALLLDALRELVPRRVATTVLEPVSVLSAEAVEELLGQTRAILAFSGEMPTDLLGGQQAFNLLPVAATETAAALRRLTGVELETASQQVVRAGVFHGVALSTCIEFEQPVGDEALAAAIEVRPGLHLHPTGATSRKGSAGDPVAVAGEHSVHVSLAPLRGPGDGSRSRRRWFWVLADNLTTVGAWNAVSIGLPPTHEVN
ncbi:MAG: hypothetical protein DWQ36_23350 [Acidobacteria bacterium]|nr:MAG: hypothetical protein DWQ30_21845 [Acidobacteriota bacterium]REK00096.1 MAG: hypothetical protein DWQ36_23350 [Acidobacteriota bacterium]